MSVAAASALMAGIARAIGAQPTLAATLQAVAVDRVEPSGALPAVTLAVLSDSDWSTKTERGREVVVRLAVHDRPGEGDRARALMTAVADALAAPPALAGWRIVSLAERAPGAASAPRPASQPLAEWRARLFRLPEP